MSTANHDGTAGQQLRQVDALDLEPVVYKLMHPEPGDKACSLAEANRAIALYQCFLKLCVLYPGTAIVPTRQLDHVWHTRMLDTAKYRTDCDHVFGHFMDHFPYPGLRGQDDRRARRAGFAQTRRLLREHFGIEIGDQPAASACRNHGDGHVRNAVRPLADHEAGGEERGGSHGRGRDAAGGPVALGGVGPAAVGDRYQLTVVESRPGAAAARPDRWLFVGPARFPAAPTHPRHRGRGADRASWLHGHGGSALAWAAGTPSVGARCPRWPGWRRRR